MRFLFTHFLTSFVYLSHSVKDLRQQITQVLKGISHESLDVRQMALTKLKNQLHNNQVKWGAYQILLPYILLHNINSSHSVYVYVEHCIASHFIPAHCN